MYNFKGSRSVSRLLGVGNSLCSLPCKCILNVIIRIQTYQDNARQDLSKGVFVRICRLNILTPCSGYKLHLPREGWGARFRPLLGLGSVKNRK